MRVDSRQRHDDPSRRKARREFGKLTPVYPSEQLRRGDLSQGLHAARYIDLVAPVGKGQRESLIVSPPKGR